MTVSRRVWEYWSGRAPREVCGIQVFRGAGDVRVCYGFMSGWPSRSTWIVPGSLDVED